MNINRQPHSHWWQKILGLFRRERRVTIFEEISDSPEPLVLLDGLQAIVTELRSTLDLNERERWDLNVLAVSTYLYHIDRMLVKIRENLLTIRYRMEQFKAQDELLQSHEFIRVKDAEEHCYIAIINLMTLLKQAARKKMVDDEVINRIHALELESANLNMAVRSLNQLAFRYETLQQLAALEQTLNQPLITSPSDFVHTHQGVMYSSTEMLQNQLQEIVLAEDAKWLTVFIDVHDMLKKCYVVARKSVIKDLLDKMEEHIQNLVAAGKQKKLDQALVFKELNAIFNNLQSIRFNCHRESRCSKNLFDKVKLARQQLRKACEQHPLGREYLSSTNIKREPLRDKLKSSL